MTDDTPTPENLSQETPANGNGRRTVSLYRHPLAAIGGAIVVSGVMAFAFLVFQDLTAPEENSYRSIVTFVIIPGVIVFGVLVFLLSIRLQVVAARKEGEDVRFALRVEPTDPKYMRNLWLFLGLSAVGVAVVGFIGFKAYEATDSNAFCGETCHTPMEPEAVAHKASPHANVMCVDCHIGSGTQAYIQAKMNGMKQLWGVVTDSYERPIHTPIEMRGAHEICEECHWPDTFWGSKFANNTYYSLDDASSAWNIALVFDLGAEPGTLSHPGGVHWHTSSGFEIDYIADDHERQEISWVRVTGEDGSERVFTRPGDFVPEPGDPDYEVRRFDCMDCHNRPAHSLEIPTKAVNEAITNGDIPRELPEIKDVSLEVLLDEYSTREQAHEAIPQSLTGYYETRYPQLADASKTLIEKAAEGLLGIYDANFFPEMKTDARIRQYNIGHLAWDGCFRCHDGEMQDTAGNLIPNDCNSCHLIVGQGEGDEPLTDLTLTGLEFQHPFDDVKWEDRDTCSSCHAALEGR